MISESLQKTIEFVQNASPLVWDALLKQVYITAIGQIVFVIGLILVAVALYKIGENCAMKATAKNMWGELGWASKIIGLLLVFIALMLLVSAVGRFANPEFYAIKYVPYLMSR